MAIMNISSYSDQYYTITDLPVRFKYWLASNGMPV